MGAELVDTAVGTAAVENAQAAADAAPEVASKPGKMKIAGDNRDILTSTVGGKVIVHTPELSIPEQMDMSLAMPAMAEGKAVGVWCYVACTVRMIDGEAIGFPATYPQIKAIVKRAGDTAMAYLMSRYGAEMAKMAEQAKNAQSTPDSD